MDAAAREALKLKEANEWLQQVLAKRFATEKFQRHEVIAPIRSHERIGPAYSTELAGLGVYFCAKEKGFLLVYTPSFGEAGCELIASLADGFAEGELFDAVDGFIQRRLR